MIREEALEQFHQDVASRHLRPLWEAGSRIMTKQPKTKAVPYVWKWELIKKKLERAGELIRPEDPGSDRRVLMLENPGLGDQIWGSTTHTLTTAVQLILPGETAPSHRHSMTAIRFIMDGKGAYTTVNGEKIHMNMGDFLLTSGWCWHEHGHEGDEPMFWMDTLDIPFVLSMNAGFFEPDPRHYQPVELPDDYSTRRYADGMLRPIQDHKKRTYPSPIANYNWSKTETALRSLSDFEPDPFDGYAIEFINPNNGEAANESIGCWMQMLQPGQHTKAHRHVNSAVYHVFQGSGYSVVDGVRYDWSKGDFFVIPTWCWHEHVCTSSEPVFLFSVNDVPLMERNFLQKEEAHPDGQQTVTDTFQPVTA